MGLQLTRGSEYGIRAMTYLAARPSGEVSSLQAISSAQDVPPSFLAKILQSLVHAELVVSHRGARGGFALARPADQITVADVIEAVDGPLSLNKCVVGPETCSWSPTCPVHQVWMRAQAAVMDVLGTATLADVATESLIRTDA